MAFPNLRALAEILDAKVFVSTWERRGSKVGGVINFQQLKRMFGDRFGDCFPGTIWGKHLAIAFPTLAARIDSDNGKVDASEIKSYFPNADINIDQDESFLLSLDDESVGDSNSAKMLYHIWRCNELKRAFERKALRRFDVVMRFRPDIFVEKRFLDSLLNSDLKNDVYVPQTRLPGFVNDVFALSSSESADRYASLFGKALLSPQRKWNLVHLEMHDHLVECGLNIKEMDVPELLVPNSKESQARNRQIFISICNSGEYNREFLPRLEMGPDVFKNYQVMWNLGDQIEVDPTTASFSLSASQLDLSQADLRFIKMCTLVFGNGLADAGRWDEAMRFYIATLIAYLQIALDSTASVIELRMIFDRIKFGCGPNSQRPKSAEEVASILADENSSLSVLFKGLTSRPDYNEACRNLVGLLAGRGL